MVIKKISDLIEGEVYYQSNPSEFIFIHRRYGGKTEKIGYSPYIYNNGLSNISGGDIHNGSNISQVRLATPLEKKWLLDSITAGKVVKRPTELTYDIY